MKNIFFFTLFLYKYQFTEQLISIYDIFFNLMFKSKSLSIYKIFWLIFIITRLTQLIALIFFVKDILFQRYL